MVNDWYHYAGIYKPSEYLKIFKDGVEIAVLEDSVLSKTYVNNLDTWIGARRHHTDVWRTYHFKGALDDIRIYNYALSDSSIWKLYSENNWPETEYHEPELPDTLVAYYPFSGSAEDSSGFENNGEVFGATLTKDRFGNPNSAYKFDGFNDFINGGSSESLRIDGDLTLSFWFNTPSFLGYSSGIITYQGSNTSGLERNALYKINFPNDNTLNYNHEDENAEGNVNVFENLDLKKNSWYHVLLKRDTTSRELKLFINGEFADSAKFESVPYGGELSTLRIGENHGTVNPDRFFSGVLDDIRIFNYAISDSSIWNLYTEGGWPETRDTTIVPNDTLAAYYPFNGDASDSSGYGNHGEVFGAQLTEDRFGRDESAYHFDGSGDFIEINNPEQLHSRKNLSVSFWARGASKDTAFVGLISKTNMQPFGIAIDNGDRMLFSISDNRIPLNMVVNNLNVNANEWYQYIAVFKAGEYMRLFQNGIEIGTLYGSIPSRMDLTSGSILFGATEIVTETKIDTLFFNGDIDDIRFYNYDLTPDDASELYLLESKVPVNNELLLDTPQDYKLYQNYPNPFNPSTTIKFDLPEQGKISLKIYDITGRLVASLIEGVRTAGVHQINFDASGLASGIYIYELRTNDFSSIKKFTLIK